MGVSSGFVPDKNRSARFEDVGGRETATAIFVGGACHPCAAPLGGSNRYLYVRWGTELSNFVVLTGEWGDTDYEGLLGGVHKTVVLKGTCGDSRKLHVNRTYPLEHVKSLDITNLVQTEGSDPIDLKNSLSKLAILKP